MDSTIHIAWESPPDLGSWFVAIRALSVAVKDCACVFVFPSVLNRIEVVLLLLWLGLSGILRNPAGELLLNASVIWVAGRIRPFVRVEFALI